MHLPSRPLAASLSALIALGTVTPVGSAIAADGWSVLEGRLTLGVAEDETGRVADSAFIVDGLESQEVSLPPGEATRLAGKKVRASGRKDGDRVKVSAINEAPGQGADAAQAGGITAAEGPDGTATADETVAASLYPGARNVAGVRRVAIINFNFSNDRRVPFSNAAVRSAAFSATRSMASYYREVSGDRIDVTGSVFGWYTIPAQNSGCQTSTWASQARSAAVKAGVNLSSYDHIVYSFPKVSSCWWYGLAEISGRGSWLNGQGTNHQVMGHELGHNLGLWHARSKRCVNRAGTRVAFSGSCTTNEYGDPFEAMGLTSRHFNTTHRTGIGIVPEDGVRIVSATRTLTLAPASSPSGIRLIRIPRASAPGTYFDLEFRPNTGVFDRFGTGSTNRGVLIRISGGLLASTNLLDMTPSTVSFGDAALVSGRAWKHGLDRVTIGVGAVTATGIRVSITFGPDVHAPSAPSNLAARAYSTSVTLSWSAAWDNVAVSAYRLYLSGTLIGSLPGTSRAYTDTGRQPLTEYRYTLRAVDAAGNVGPAASITTTTLPPDVNPPSAPSWLTASAGLDSASLAWGAATDPEGPVTSYRVWRDGRVIANPIATTRTFTDTGLAPGTYTYAVAALDTAGNVGVPLTRTVRIVGPDLETPSAPADLSAATSQEAVSLSWRAASDNVGVTRYLVARDGVVIATLSSGARGYRDSGLASGTTYRYTVRAVDGAGNVGPAAEIEATVLPPDTEAPSAPQGLRVTDERRHSVRIEWDPATDNVGVVSYRLYENGRLAATIGGTSTWDRPGEVITVYTVVALDAAGNASPASEPLVVEDGR